MHPAAARAVLAIAIVTLLAPQALAAYNGKTDPDWPCQQIKTPTFSLASIWAGPQLDLNSQSWRNESDVADLKAQMAQRRVPMADVETTIAAFKAKAGPDGDAKLLRAFAAAFADLSQQRSADHRRPGSNRPQAKSVSRSHPRGKRGRAKTLQTRTVAARRRPARTVKSGCYGTFASSTIAVRRSLMSAKRRR